MISISSEVVNIDEFAAPRYSNADSCASDDTDVKVPLSQRSFRVPAKLPADMKTALKLQLPGVICGDELDITKWQLETERFKSRALEAESTIQSLRSELDESIRNKEHEKQCQEKTIADIQWGTRQVLTKLTVSEQVCKMRTDEAEALAQEVQALRSENAQLKNDLKHQVSARKLLEDEIQHLRTQNDKLQQSLKQIADSKTQPKSAESEITDASDYKMACRQREIVARLQQLQLQKMSSFLLHAHAPLLSTRKICGQLDALKAASFLKGSDSETRQPPPIYDPEAVFNDVSSLDTVLGIIVYTSKVLEGYSGSIERLFPNQHLGVVSPPNTGGYGN